MSKRDRKPRRTGALLEGTEAMGRETVSEYVRVSVLMLRCTRDSSSQYSLGFNGRPAAPLIGRLQVALKDKQYIYINFFKW